MVIKKMKNKIFMGLAAIAMVAFLASCGKKPQAEIDAANTAIEAAKTAEAPVYLSADFAAVQDSMNAINVEIEAMSSKLFKNYDVVKTKLEQTIALANQVTANAAVKKEEVKKEVETAIAAMKTVVEENKTLITKAPRGKDGAEVLAQIKSEIATIDTAAAEAQGLYDKGAFMDALNKIRASNERAVSINTELKDAIAKVRR
jgi:predicted small lipoprotein YifL